MKKVGRLNRIPKRIRITLLAAVIAGGGLAAIGIYSLSALRGNRAAAQEVSVREVQAETGTISNTIVGTGNLAYEESTSITIPSGVVVDEVKVESNDRVSKGDVLAVVNQTSVLRAMEDIQEEIEELDEEIDESKDDTGSQSVKSKIDGKVKKIYVQEGQEVSDCMMAEGALMLLSMEDYLDVENESDAELTVIATTGTVEEICVSEGDNIYTGTTLMKIENSGQSLEYQEQMAERQELAQRLQELIVLSQSGVITAESDGVIRTVDILAEGSTAETGIVQVSKNATAVVGSAQGSQEQDTAGGGSGQDSQDTETGGNQQDTSGAAEKILTLKVTDSGTCNQAAIVVATPQTGETPQTALHAEDGSYEGVISWKPECKKFAAETSYQAYVALTAGEGYLFGDDSISQIKTGVLSGVSLTENGKKLSFYITYPFTAKEQTDGQDGNGNNGGTGDGNGNGTDSGTGNGDGNNNGNADGNNGETGSGNGNNNGNADGNNSGTGSGNSDGNVAGSENASGTRSVSLAATSTSAAQSSSQDSSTETADSDSEVTAFTISSSDTMILSVNVDELDINSVTKDQQAEIVFDAIEDETFEGTVTKVGSSASSSSGGVAKYTVELEIPGDERMKEGMNASATITIEERENVVTIPVNALQERGNRVFVYTQADSDGKLSGEQEVTTGLSDGNTVEITEGLSEGDKVYYQKTGNTSGEGNSQGFGGMEGGPGGNMGDMPQGDFKGGESGSGMRGGGKPDGMSNGGGMPGNQQ